MGAFFARTHDAVFARAYSSIILYIYYGINLQKIYILLLFYGGGISIITVYYIHVTTSAVEDYGYTVVYDSVGLHGIIKRRKKSVKITGKNVIKNAENTVSIT